MVNKYYFLCKSRTTYQCHCTEDIHIIGLPPLLGIRVRDLRNRRQPAMIYDESIDLAKGLYRRSHDFGRHLRTISHLSTSP